MISWIFKFAEPPRALPCGRPLLTALLVLIAAPLFAQDKDKAPDSARGNGFPTGKPMTYEEITDRAMPSIVVVHQLGRDGREEEGVGAGFVISQDGLIATALHVIGEGRAIKVKFKDGSVHDVAGIHAWDRKLDLAILKIDAKGLQPLPLGDSDELKQGTIVVALGNPHGLEHSVVKGEISVVSSKREIDEIEMIQVAIPVEPGNSGSPVLDLYGRVQGVMTMKSAVTRNLGYAVPVNRLQSLVDKPNPTPMDRWQRIGSLDFAEWIPVFGANWFRRSGQIRVEGVGDGFGGRALCLSRIEPPERPYEVAVRVKLDDESGAAGLVFASDGRDRHYGFYPTGGQLRLTRFDGPTVFNWRILQTLPSEHYRPGRWNDIKVRFEKEKIVCYVNDRVVMESDDKGLKNGWVGLAKFRDTEADFRQFRVGRSLDSLNPSPEAVASVLEKVSDLQPAGNWDDNLIRSLSEASASSTAVLKRRAEELDRQARQLRLLAASVHTKQVEKELLAALEGEEEDIDLFHAALLLDQLDNPELDPAPYRRSLKRMAGEIRDGLPEDADADARIAALKKSLFEDNGFHGSRTDYDNPANSYMSRVMDEREGLPITLSVLFMELARELGIRSVVGVPLPSHFVVRYLPDEGSAPVEFIDVFEQGEILTLDDAAQLVNFNTGRDLEDEHLIPSTKRQIIERMLRNLVSHRFDLDSPEDVLPHLELLVALDPNDPYERLRRGMLRARLENTAGAREDFGWILETRPHGIDLRQVERMFRGL